MRPQNPFDTWENSEEYYGLQDKIANIRMKQQDSKTSFAAGAFGRHVMPEAQSQQDMLDEDFERQLQNLNQMSEKGKFDFDFNKQYSSGGPSLGVRKKPQFKF